MTAAAGGSAGRVTATVAARTDCGLVREQNEDAFGFAILSGKGLVRNAVAHTYTIDGKGAVFVVADGMGGAEHGEIASDMAVRILVDEVRRRWVSGGDGRQETFAVALKAALEQANTQIHRKAALGTASRMGTTATIAGLLGDTAYIAQIGDSRAYLVRAGKAYQITRDQSLVQEMVEAGELTPDEAASSRHRHIILQALGPEPTVDVDLTHQQLRRGDVLVLCTDGLSGVVSDDEIAAEICSRTDLSASCDQLVRQARERGGPDNITLLAVRLEGPDLQLAADDDRVGRSPYTIPEDDVTTPSWGSAIPEAETAPTDLYQAPVGARMGIAIVVVLIIVALAIAALT